MTKEEEIKICKDLMEKYKELDDKVYKRNDGTFNSTKKNKILDIITDKEDKDKFNLFLEMYQKRKNPKKTPTPKKTTPKKTTPKKTSKKVDKKEDKEDKEKVVEKKEKQFLEDPKLLQEDIVLESEYYEDDKDIVGNIKEGDFEFCKIDYNKNVYRVYNIDTGDETNITIDNDDTNLIVIKKIIDNFAYEATPVEEVFAFYETNKNKLPIGFNYNNSPINIYDNNFKRFINRDVTWNKESIDNSFVNDEGNPIMNDLTNTYDKLFSNNYNINYIQNDKIYFRFLNKVLSNPDYDLNTSYSKEIDNEDIDIRKLFFGFVKKYFPRIKNDMRYITDYNCQELKKYRIKQTDLVKNEISILDKLNSDLLNTYNKNIRNNDKICEIFNVRMLKINNLLDCDNRINIVKIFSDIKCVSDIHFMQLVLAKNTNNKYYKINKDLLKTKTNIIGTITQDMINNWYKGHTIINEISYQKLYIENAIIFKIFINELNCSNLEDKYITLVINVNGVIECIIDCNINKSDIDIILNRCNKMISELNDNLKYSEKNQRIVLFENKFIRNISDTKLDYFNFDLYLSLLKTSTSLIPYDLDKIVKVLKNYKYFFRINSVNNEKNSLKIIYKLVDDYSSSSNIRNIITKLKDPNENNLSNDEVIEELVEAFNIGLAKAKKLLDDWNELFVLKEKEGVNLFKKRKDELGVMINISSSGNNIKYNIKNVNNYKEYEKIVYLLETITYNYKYGDIKSYDTSNKEDDIAEEEVIEEEEEAGAEAEVEEDDDDSELSEYSYESSGGAGKDKYKIFLDRLNMYNPEVFNKKGFYTRFCQSSYKQPLIVTQQELNRILNKDEIVSDNKDDFMYNVKISEYSGPRSFTNRKKAADLENLGDKKYSLHEGEDLYFISPKFYDIKYELPVQEILIYDSFIGKLDLSDEDSIINEIRKEFHCNEDTAKQLYYDFKKRYPDNKYLGKDYHSHILYEKRDKDKNTGDIKDRYILFRTDKTNGFWPEDKITQKWMIVESKSQKSNKGFNSPCCAKMKGDPSKSGTGWNWGKNMTDVKETTKAVQYVYKINQSKVFPLSIDRYGSLPDEINTIFNQTEKQIRVKEYNCFIRKGIELNTFKVKEIPNYINAYAQANGEDTVEFYENILSFIKDKRYGLKRYLRLGESKISQLFKKEIDENDIIKFSKNVSDEEIKELNIDPSTILNNDISNNNTLELIFLVNLYVSRERYLYYLENYYQGFRDDIYINPLIDAYNKENGINIITIVFENEDGNIYIKDQLYNYNDYYISSKYPTPTNLCFIYQEKEHYEPIIYIDGLAQTEKYINFYNKVLQDSSEINTQIFKSNSYETYYNNYIKNEKFTEKNIVSVYVNSNNKISHVITEDNYILPYLGDINDNYNYVYSLDDYIGSQPSFSDYVKLLKKMKFNLNDRNENNVLVNNKDYYNNYKIKGISVIEVNGKKIISDIILENNSYIPLSKKDEYNDSLSYEVLSTDDNYKVDTSIQILNKDDILDSTEDEDMVSNEIKFNKILYYYLRDSIHKDNSSYYIFINGGARLIKQGLIYEFILKSDEIMGNHLYLKKMFPDLNSELKSKIRELVLKDDGNDNDQYYEVKLETTKLNYISYLINSPKIIEDKRDEILDYILKNIDDSLFNNIDNYVPNKLRYISKFIELLISYKDNHFKYLEDGIEEKVDLNSLSKNILPNELFFDSKDYNNGFIELEFNKEYIDIELYDKPVRNKPIITLLKNIPNFVKKYFKNSDIEIPFGNSDIDNIALWLEDSITKDMIIDVLKNTYETFFTKKDEKNINKINKYNKVDNFKELSDMLDKDSYTLTPTDLFVIYNEFNINFILITNKYSDKYQEIVINNKDLDSPTMVLYHNNDSEDKSKYNLGIIKINENYKNSIRSLEKFK